MSSTVHDDERIQLACRWQARLQAPDCSDLDRQQCQRWQEADPANRLAFKQAETLFTSVFVAGMESEALQGQAEQDFRDSHDPEILDFSSLKPLPGPPPDQPSGLFDGKAPQLLRKKPPRYLLYLLLAALLSGAAWLLL